ncbi:MAG: hypothetical protein HY799_03305 [Nitrosomonadales bacterium]|nr:hypothetical protein [Nitrosomonadales bacterium]
MKKDSEMDKMLLETIISLEVKPSFWKAAPVEVEPQKWLEAWQVVKVVKSNGFEERFGFHFVGRNCREHNGAVSSKIEKFDPKTLRGVTHSGRVYQLVGLPGYSSDAQYVLDCWSQANQVETANATEEFVKQYGISLEHIDQLMR